MHLLLSAAPPPFSSCCLCVWQLYKEACAGSAFPDLSDPFCVIRLSLAVFCGSTWLVPRSRSPPPPREAPGPPACWQGAGLIRLLPNRWWKSAAFWVNIVLAAALCSGAPLKHQLICSVPPQKWDLYSLALILEALVRHFLCSCFSHCCPLKKVGSFVC